MGNAVDCFNGTRPRDAVNAEDLYAAPVPAVDLEAFKAEVMRLANLMADNAGSSQDAHGRGSRDCSEAFARAEEEARAALQAHLDKLGGK
jgi:FMN-dependent NADH-azoreductase